MQGFEDSRSPVYIKLDTSVGLGANPVQIDGDKARATDYGILADVSGVRYFVPWGRVVLVQQVQIADPDAEPPRHITPPDAGGQGKPD